MSSKKAAERGTKRTCQSCEARFYDLNRDPMKCPMCGTQYAMAAFGPRMDLEGASALAADKGRKAPKKPAFVADTEEVAADGDLPVGVEVPEVALEGEDAAAEGEEETFLPEEEEDTDVSGFIDGGIEETGEEEA